MKDDVTADAFKELSQKLARQVAIRNANLAETKKVEMIN
jgi:ATP-binding protein involved in chromosome partitioning